MVKTNTFKKLIEMKCLIFGHKYLTSRVTEDIFGLLTIEKVCLRCGKIKESTKQSNKLGYNK